MAQRDKADDKGARHERAAQDERIFIEGRKFAHRSQDARGDHECVATPPMPACPCGAFTNLEWSWSHL